MRKGSRFPVFFMTIVISGIVGCRGSHSSGYVSDQSDTDGGIRIEEGTYAGRLHLIVHTPSATYHYDRAGGGFSRMIDRDGLDWIGFKNDPWDEYPASAASSYRGIPNLVFRSDDSGAGHPGHTRCVSEIAAGGNAIQSTSLSGRWRWRWTFFENHARLDVLRIDPDHPYWFLYEGTPGGVFEPSRHYFGTDTGGPRRDRFDYFRGDILFDEWRWIYIGHESVNRVIFLAQEATDTRMDTFSYLGNDGRGIEAGDGMVVFGFGRAEGATPLLHQPQSFYIGFWEEKVASDEAHQRIRRYLEGLVR